MPDRTKKEVGEIVGAVFAEVAKAVQVHKRLSYPGFGTFTVETRAARQGRNPRTGAAIAIAASKQVAFKAAPALTSAPPVEDDDEASAAQAGLVLEFSEADVQMLRDALINVLSATHDVGEGEADDEEDGADDEEDEGDDEEDWAEDEEDESDEDDGDDQQALSDDITVRFCFMKSETDSPGVSWFGEDELKDMRTCFSMVLDFQHHSSLPDDLEIESITILYDGVTKSEDEDIEDGDLGFYLKGRKLHGYPAPIIRFRVNRQVDPTAFAGSVNGSCMGVYTRKMQKKGKEEHVLFDWNGYTKALNDEERDDWIDESLNPAGVFSGKTIDLRLGIGDQHVLAGEAFITPSTVGHLATHPPTWRADCGEDQHGRWAELVVAGVTLRFRYCPAGTFQMGSPASEEGRDRDEEQHEVRLTKGFWLGETPVTQGQWEAVTGKKPRYFRGMDLPVEHVSWEDCVAFVGNLNACCPDLELRLPTEAEWEYACRAGTTGPTYLGANDAPTLDRLGWYAGNSQHDPHPVGKKAPNAWGLYDTLGNVWEWCADWHADHPSQPQVDPKGPSTGAERVIRGGAWGDDASTLRAAARERSEPGDRHAYEGLGFRVAKSSP
jgi:sulfatase modifying factor 1